MNICPGPPLPVLLLLILLNYSILAPVLLTLVAIFLQMEIFQLLFPPIPFYNQVNFMFFRARICLLHPVEILTAAFILILTGQPAIAPAALFQQQVMAS